MEARRRRWSGLELVVFLAAWAVAQAPGSPPAPKARPKRQLPGETVELSTKDGWRLSAVYLPAKENRLTFVLLHDARGRSQDWYWLARAMAQKGIGFLALDLRGHGLSQNPPAGAPSSWNKFKITKDYNEWDNMREDVAAAVAFLSEKKVPAERIALGGSDVGGSIALKYAAVHPEAPLVFLLSPGLRYHEVLSVNAIRAYKDRPILLVVADEDRISAPVTPILYEFAKQSAGQERAALLRVAKGHGTQMLGLNRDLIGKILDWIENPLKAPELTEVSTQATRGGSTDGLPTENQLDQLYGGDQNQEVR